MCYAHADDSDTEGTSPSLAKLSTSAGSSRGGAGGGGKKTERNFWQYNVQAKGPKGQKIVIETKIEDPHVLNDIVDPVFSGDVQLQVWQAFFFFAFSKNSRPAAKKLEFWAKNLTCWR